MSDATRGKPPGGEARPVLNEPDTRTATIPAHDVSADATAAAPKRKGIPIRWLVEQWEDCRCQRGYFAGTQRFVCRCIEEIPDEGHYRAARWLRWARWYFGGGR